LLWSILQQLPNTGLLCPPPSLPPHIPSQIGSADVSNDLFVTNTNHATDVANFNMTSGSGGGKLGTKIGGRGGGSILIRCGSLNITGGALSADGSHSSSANLGSGSGGSITLLATTYKGTNALLSVKGGEGILGRNIAAGGGGRIYIKVSIPPSSLLSVCLSSAPHHESSRI
jgi:hypothetical protein